MLGRSLPFALTVSVLALLVLMSVASAASAVAMTAATAVVVSTTSLLSRFLVHLAAGRQLGSGSRIGFYIVGIVSQFADLLAQKVGVGFFAVVRNGHFGGLGIAGVIFHPFEEGNVLFEQCLTF